MLEADLSLLGARSALYFGLRLIRPLVVCVCTAMAVKLLLG
jgi:uncharacterized membrane protein YfcA